MPGPSTMDSGSMPAILSGSTAAEAMFDSVMFLSPFCVVETFVDIAHQIAGDAAGAVERNAFTDNFLLLFHSILPLYPLEFLFDFRKTFRGNALSFTASAAGADVIDNAGVPAHGVIIHGVIDAAVAYALFPHIMNNFFKCFRILGNVAVQLHIGDV